MAVSKIHVLFVCTGNICRSPLAESIFNQMVEQEGIAPLFSVDSAGTEGYHIGSAPDLRSLTVAKSIGIGYMNHKARQFVKTDFEHFDYILVMDHLNYDAVISKSNEPCHHEKVMLFRSFDSAAGDFYDVPDPYYGTEADFAEVGEIVTRSGYGFLKFLRDEGKI